MSRINLARISRTFAAGLVLALLAPLPSRAEIPTPPAGPGALARISARIDDSQRVAVRGRVPRAASAGVDLGEADPALPAERAVMILSASPAQEADLGRYLRDVQTPGRPDYHHWLTPEEFGRRYGVADSDHEAVRSWLQGQGFRLEAPSPGRRAIVFSGNVGQLNRSFAARIHRYQWHGEAHMANSAVPSIPRALAEVVHGFASFGGLMLQPQFRRGGVAPQMTFGDGSHALGPTDFAVIYDLSPIYSAGTNGSGHSIAIIGRSEVQNVDLTNFRAEFGLSPSLPTVVLAGQDPGLVADDQLESDLDLEWAGGVAPSAAIKFVTAKSTSTTDGIILSSMYAVEHDVADIISVSYGACEAEDANSTALFNQLWQQAAAQGISVFVSSGDAGAAGCDAASSANATQGRGVNLVCSSPYATCVGGTQFAADVSSPGTYWSPGNASGTQASALQYIGESVWNQSGTVSGGSALWSSGGGASVYFGKPSWQLAPGVPSDGWRDVPDVALTASSTHDPYLIYSSDRRSSSTLLLIGGTSASTPSMAGIAALVVQRQNGRVGAFNPVLYGLSSLQVAGGAAVFHRVTSGNNSVPGQTGFSASTGNPTYNQATGLGSVDAGLLFTHWGDFTGTKIGIDPTLAVIPASAAAGSATLTLPAGSTWSASISAGASWLTVSPASGTGSAPLTYQAAANTTATARTGTITIAGQTLTITQAAASGASQLATSSTALNFGTDEVGTNAPTITLLVSDTGGSSLSVGALSITGAASGDFVVSGSCVAGLTLVSGASCYLKVVFSPTTAGNRSAVLHIGGAAVSLAGVGSWPVGGDGPLPPWCYALLGSLLLGIAAIRGRRSRA